MTPFRPECNRLLGITLWIGLLLCTGCSLAPVAGISPERLNQLPRQHEITSTPYFSQDAYQCGPASLAMVLGHYGLARTPSELTPWLFTPNAQGTFPAELDAVSRMEGFVSYPIATLDSLLLEIAAGHPVLVLQNLGMTWYTRWHFAVVVGYDLEQRSIILRSGELERRITGLDTFNLTWQRSGFWGRAILPPDQLPASAERQTYLHVASELEQTGPLTSAERAYQTALEAWPEANTARFGLANTLLKQQHYAKAIESFLELLQRAPLFASGWNNFSYALGNGGCPASAHQAALCAARLAPEDPAITTTANEWPGSMPDEHHCPPIHCPQRP